MKRKTHLERGTQSELDDAFERLQEAKRNYEAALGMLRRASDDLQRLLSLMNDEEEVE